MSFFLRTICLAMMALPVMAETHTLTNERLHAEFGDRGLVAIADTALKSTFRFTQDEFSLTLSGLNISSLNLPHVQAVIPEKNRLVYRFSTFPYGLDVIYEL